MTEKAEDFCFCLHLKLGWLFFEAETPSQNLKISRSATDVSLF